MALLDPLRLKFTTLIALPRDHLQECHEVLKDLVKETPEESPDAPDLAQAEQMIYNISMADQLRSFQYSMGRGPNSNLEWHDLVTQEKRNAMTDQEIKRQA